MQPGPDTLRLVGDVGGTNARFALLDDFGHLQAIETLATADHADLAAAVQAYLAPLGRPALREAAVAIANPIEGDWLQMTNSPWRFSIEATRQALGLRRLCMLNDFEALAMSVPGLAGAQLEAVGGGSAAEGAPKVVIGPGTGLGMASLVRGPGGRWLAVAGEGGHATLAPTCAREADILRVLWQRHEHVSVERAVSGMGLENLYRAIATLDGVPVQPLAAADISQRALAGADAQCTEALECFCALLGAAAGNLALTLGARGGVYVGGGIVARLGDWFARSPFRAAFEAKGRYRDYLGRIPTWVIRAEEPALLGAARALQQD
ncbi:glucokinase [Azohydromonas aeria]|uniref:glucokinase n=1 Tax=Azohydromonas aeria TaxID=2590212 RepID=UPI0012F91899|nr:glucokinase [Azohydromonas aeria]